MQEFLHIEEVYVIENEASIWEQERTYVAVFGNGNEGISKIPSKGFWSITSLNLQSLEML